eukprot:9262491-Pyramimonas_sp.AAC.1
MAGEVVALSSALAEAEWLQMLYWDIVDGSLLTENWRKHTGPFVSLLRQECALKKPPEGNVSIVDAKGIFDALDRITA